MLFEVDGVIETLQGATAARAAIVNRTLEYLDQMAADEGNNPAVLRDLAVAYQRIAKIQGGERTAHLGGQGSIASTRQSYEKARKILERLAANAPGDFSLQLDYASSNWGIGESYRYEGDLDRTLAVDQEAVARIRLIQERWRNDPARLTEIHYVLSAFLTNLSTIAFEEGSIREGLERAREALSIRESILAAHPGDQRAMRVVGIAHNYLANGLKTAKLYPEAELEDRKAIEIWQPIADADPHNAEIRSMIADATGDRCLDLAHLGRIREAVAACNQSTAWYQAAAQGDSKDIQASEDLATAYSARSELADLMKLPREALEWEKKARALYPNIQKNDPDALEIATYDAASLLHYGSLEMTLGDRANGMKEVARALEMLAEQRKRSPKSRTIYELWEKAAAAVNR